MRPVISYDDITAPQEPTPQIGPQFPSPNPPPAKKRKTNQRTRPTNGRPQQHFQHWDDPGSHAPQMSYDSTRGESTAGGATRNARERGEDGEVEEEDEEDESRELTQEEVWDDSALVDAWNSAMAEYEAFHGPGSKWKEEPVKKSPLWYNVPPTTTKRKEKAKVITNGVQEQITQAEVEVEVDSTPLNFDSFVPTHDPSLASADYAANYLTNPPGVMVSQDEAFSRALSAMYWGGYWTAVYHCHRSKEMNRESGGEEEDTQDEGEDLEEIDQDEEMLPAQR